LPLVDVGVGDCGTTDSVVVGTFVGWESVKLESVSSTGKREEEDDCVGGIVLGVNLRLKVLLAVFFGFFTAVVVVDNKGVAEELSFDVDVVAVVDVFNPCIL